MACVALKSRRRQAKRPLSGSSRFTSSKETETGLRPIRIRAELEQEQSPPIPQPVEAHPPQVACLQRLRPDHFLLDDSEQPIPSVSVQAQCRDHVVIPVAHA